MWHELYAPTCVADLVWSRQKQEALLSTLRGIVSGTLPPRALLLYGPPGCAKLSSLCVLLHQVAAERVRATLPAASETDSTAPSTSSRTPRGRGQAGATRRAKTQRATERVSGSASSGVTSDVSSALASVVLNTSSEFSATFGHVTLHILHTCDVTIQRYAQFLRSILMQMVEHTRDGSGTGDGAGLAFDTAQPEPGSAHVLDEKGESPASPEEVLLTAHVVKFYGERASAEMHTYTAAFMRQYEALVSAAGVDTARGERATVFSHAAGHGGGAPGSMLTLKLQRHLIAFIYTTHDSHNDKVDLARSIPNTLLRSTSCELFHCTPITAINMKRRLLVVLDKEAKRRRRRAHSLDSPSWTDSLGPTKKHKVDPAASQSPGLSSSSDRHLVVIDLDAECNDDDVDAFDSTALSTRKRAGGSRTPTRRGTLGAASRQGVSVAPVLSAKDLDAIIAAGQGDVRQTLLQLQWASLGPSSSDDAHSVSADVARLNDLSYHDAVQYALGSLRDADRGSTCNKATTAAVTPLSAGTPGSDIILISDSDEEEKKSSATPTASTTTALSSSHGGGPRSVLDLLDDIDVAEADVNASSHNVTPTATPSPRLQERRYVAPTSRDEYMDLSHGTARLLTQKYTLQDVTSILNVPPRKLLDYMTNNAFHYFTPTQMEACAACVNAASEADALRAMDVLAAGGNYRRNQLASTRTSHDGTDGMAVSQMDSMALTLFDSSYRVFHRDVYIPRHFAAMRPAPFLREAYPRVRESMDAKENGGGSGRRGGRWGRDADDFSSKPVSEWNESDWQDAARERLANPAMEARLAAPWACTRPAQGHKYRGDDLSQSLRQSSLAATRASEKAGEAPPLPPILLPEKDVLREYLPERVDACGAAEPLICDYAPYAQYIVFCRPLSSSQPSANGPGTPTPSAVPHRTLFSLPRATNTTAKPTATAQSSPRRTTFSFTAAPAPKGSAPLAGRALRLCSELRLSILKRGLPPSTPLRASDFAMSTYGSNGAMAGTGAGSAAFDGFPLIPEGDTIEDFSD